MKSFTFISSFIIFILVSNDCQAQLFSNKKKQAEENQKIMDSWLGHTKAELIRTWGVPSNRTDDGQGGEVLIWEYSRSTGMVVSGVYIQRNNVDYKEMFADKEGKIYYWRTGSR